MNDPAVHAVTSKFLSDHTIASLDYHVCVDSTNSVALRWLQRESGTGDDSATDGDTLFPRLVITDRQTGGRGRMGRTWQSTDDSLVMSLIWPAVSELMSIAVGVAVAETIEFLIGPVRCGLKWPNDVWLVRRKVAGVLIEAVESPRHLRRGRVCSVIGIGLNVRSSPTLPGNETTSLCEATGKAIGRADVLEQLIPTLINRLETSTTDPGELLRSFQDRCVLTGELVQCDIGTRRIEGVCEGVSAVGELLIRSPAGTTHRCRSGEVTRVRRG